MPIRVLIADDHGVFRAGLRALFDRQADLEVVAEAADGRETLEALERHAPDVLVLDISMPRMTGIEVARRALARQPDLAIVVLTMHEESFYLHQLMRDGVRGFVLKRSTGTDLLRAIRAVAAGRRYIDPSLAGEVLASYVDHGAARNSSSCGLTAREQEVCCLLAMGHTNAEVAEKLFISPRTVETHRAHIMGKLEVKTRAELVRFAVGCGLTRME